MRLGLGNLTLKNRNKTCSYRGNKSKIKMRIFHIILVFIVFTTSCTTKTKNPNTSQINLPIVGTWQLISGTTIKGTDTTFTNYTKNQEIIKIINRTHFAFLRHDLGKDSITIFVSGGGRCEIGEKKYIEYLDFCNYREWENNSFEFEYNISGDTLITNGIEKVDKLNINYINIEKLARVKE